ncbi:MAG: TerB family tellurite resistance protein [Arenicellaceae bacterium]|nr:TerB family tellurite resistance protein [Arenicellaceae bacterium]
MISTLKNLIYGDISKNSDKQDLQLDTVAAALIFEVIRADGKIDDSEMQSLTDILKHDFEINKDELDSMLNEAKETSNQTTSVQHLTSKINQHWSNEERQNLLVHLWRIAMADDHIDTHERHIIRRIANLLYLTESQIYSAKELAKQI